MKRYTVTLSSEGNPDFGQNPNQPLWGCEPNQSKQVDTIEEASKACQQFIHNNDLGAGNWSGGQLMDNQLGKQIGQISYNGRVWDMNPDWQKRKELPKEHICKCNNCDARIIDENPKNERKQYVEGNEVSMIQSEDEDGIHWACPNCETDEYLMDLN